MWRKVLLSGLALFIILTTIAPVWAAEPSTGGLSAPIYAEKGEPQAAVSPASAARLESAFGADWQRWVAAEGSDEWSVAELRQVRAILDHTLAALAEAGLDGEQLLAGYRFQRVAGEYIRSEEQIMALANHGDQTISLADAAFVRLQGFYIYHELGHAVDYRLNRRLGDSFHEQAGSSHTADGQWLTGDGFWMRPQARDARGEATADAFALWVSSQYGGLRRPVFGGSPASLDYEAISLAAQAAVGSVVAE